MTKSTWSCLLLAPVLAVTAACVTQEKSENFLSPMVAGPIPGVGISPPTPLQPTQGATIVVTQQPITLSLSNATTSGVRPLSYVFELASDAGFSNLVFVRTGVTPGEGGQTSLRLPDALASGRSYYWRAKAEDGANIGPYSYPVVFTISNFIGKPTAIAPAGAIGTVVPSFTIGNAPKSGTVGQVSYMIEVASSVTFTNPVAVWMVDEQPGETKFSAPGAVPADTQLYWRVRGADFSTAGEWSNPQAFKTPVIHTPPPPTGPSGGGAPCGPPYPTTPLGILECQRSKYPLHMSKDQHVAFLAGSARDFNAAGIPGGPYGLLRKEAGNNCGGYSCDILCAGNGSSQRQYDVLLDETYAIWPGPATLQTNPLLRIDQCDIP